MSEVQSGTSKKGFQWQRMTITLEIPGFQGSTTKQVFQVSGDDVNDVLLYSIGDRVEVSWTMYAREWNGRWYNNVELYKIKYQEGAEPVNASGPVAPETKEVQLTIETPPSEGSEDLPF